MNNTDYSLYGLLNEKSVAIPKIQRDYAQGRKGKEFIRENFLRQIYDALDKNDNLQLDFVYGRETDDSFEPLDGQQRLTTLWLVHWYLLFRAGDPIFAKLQELKTALEQQSNDLYSEKLLSKINSIDNEIIIQYFSQHPSEDGHSLSEIIVFEDKDKLPADVKTIFNTKAKDYWHLLIRFSYETRISSTEFCRAMCTKLCAVDYSKTRHKRTVADYIKDQTWFYSTWLQDPTVNSMLRTLGGSPKESDDRKTDLELIYNKFKSDINLEDIVKWLDEKPVNNSNLNLYASLKDFFDNDPSILNCFDKDLISEISRVFGTVLTNHYTCTNDKGPESFNSFIDHLKNISEIPDMSYLNTVKALKGSLIQTPDFKAVKNNQDMYCLFTPQISKQEGVIEEQFLTNKPTEKKYKGLKEFLDLAGCINSEDELSTVSEFSVKIQQYNKSIVEKSDSKTLSSKPSLFDYLVSLPGFEEKWLDTFTISKALRQLSPDCIDGKFNETDGIDYQKLFNKLFDDKSTCFSVPSITLEPEAYDDLYVKMNARGKKLTSFENWKADFFAYIKDLQKNRELTSDEAASIIKGVDSHWTSFAYNCLKKAAMDQNKDVDSNVHCVDDILFMVINRYVLNKRIVDLGSNSKIEADKTFRFLYASDLDLADSKIEYEDFTVYKECLNAESCKSLNLLFKYLEITTSDSKVYTLDSYDSVKWSFLPELIPNPKDKDKKKLILDNTKQETRAFFHSVVVYITALLCANSVDSTDSMDDGNVKAKLDNELNGSISDWQRITKKLIYNANISTVGEMCSCIKRIDEIGNDLSSNGMDVFEVLNKKDGFSIDSKSMLDRQYQEEIFKAQKIKQNDPILSKNTIERFEDHVFFNGTIRFLYSVDKEKCIILWGDVFKKFTRAQKCFPDDKTVSWNTAKEFLKYLPERKNVSFTKMGADPKGSKTYWMKDILCNTELADEVSDFLLGAAPKDNNIREDLVRVFEVITQFDGADKKQIDIIQHEKISNVHFKSGQSYFYIDQKLEIKEICETIKEMSKKGIITVDDKCHPKNCEIGTGYYYFHNGAVLFKDQNGNIYEWRINLDCKTDRFHILSTNHVSTDCDSNALKAKLDGIK